MDGRKSNGAKKGIKQGQGRKPKAEELKVIETMDKIGSPDEVFQILWGLVQSGSEQAMKLWLAYRLGAPKQSIEQNNTGEREIVIVRDGNTYPQIRSSSGTTANLGESSTV